MCTSLPPRGAGPELESALETARAELERLGLLLFSDPALPSLVGIIVGEPLRSSWWGHPRGHVIYEAMNRLDDDREVLSSKLVAGKVTYVHKRLWPAVYALGTAREAWQLEAIAAGARWLLEEVDAQGALRTDLVTPPSALRGSKRIADFARDLERRLLVHAMETHTPSGAHAKVLQTWPRWASEVQLSQHEPLSAAQARLQLEQSAARLAADVSEGVVQLPWQTRQSRRRKR
jgi:hypothetical protein